jgi:putative transposase
MALKTFKYRLYPNPAQEKNLWLVLSVARAWYNMCIAERKFVYQAERRSVSKYDQLASVKHYKHTFPQAKQVHSHVLQGVCVDVDKAFQAFFGRVKAGKKAGYPRFKSKQRFHSFGFKEENNGFRVDGRRLKVFGIGRIPVRWHRQMEGQVKTLRIIHKAGCWYACFACEVPDKPELPKTGQVIGLDVGTTHLLTDDQGRKTDNPKYYTHAQSELRIAQRALQRKQKGGKNRRKALLRVQRLHEHVQNQRRDYLHKLTHALVHSYDLIAVEDLQITNMARNRRLSKSILDSGWGLFKQLLHSKAVDAGKEVVLVNSAYTSKTCSGCGVVKDDLALSDRWFDCPHCGLSLDRDHNAAINILQRALNGRDAPVSDNVAPLPKPQGKGKRKRRSEATPL